MLVGRKAKKREQNKTTPKRAHIKASIYVPNNKILSKVCKFESQLASECNCSKHVEHTSLAAVASGGASLDADPVE